MPLRSGVLILPATAPPFALPRAPALGRSLSHFWGLVDGRADPSTALRNLCRGCLNFRRDRRLVADHFATLGIGCAPDQAQEAECHRILRLHA